MTGDRCVWVYAVADDAEPSFTGGLIGVGGGTVRPVTAAGLVAIAADVPAQEFGEDALREKLEDLHWLEQTARTHHAVIEAVAKERTVVPMRLATVYRSDEGVAGMLRARAADLREALARITGRSEWGVKVYAVTPPDEPEGSAQDASGQGVSAQDTSGQSSSERPGAAYLRRRAAQLAARQDARAQALASAKAIYAELAGRAASARSYPPQAPEIAGRSGAMVLNASYLVADEATDDFAAAVTDLAGRHPAVQLSLTGPWPAYSFTSPEDPAGAEEDPAR
jgi:Gas vesicle synthesis protein GvpL/GvpF